MRYHGGNRFGLSEDEQSLIYWKCRNYYRISEQERRIIDAAVTECAAGSKRALFEILTTGKSLMAVAMRHNISESALLERCGKFYRRIAGKI